jgi:hypothetical protein
MIATKKNKEEGETRVAVLLTAMGRDRRRQDIQVIHLGRSRSQQEPDESSGCIHKLLQTEDQRDLRKISISAEEAESW